MNYNKTVKTAIREIVSLRRILKTGKDDEGRVLTDGNMMVDLIKQAEQKLGKMIVDGCGDGQ